MKLIQISLLFQCNETIYVKRDLAKAVRKLFPGTDESTIDRYEQGALLYLFRGRCGKYCAELFSQLMTQYNHVVEKFLARTKIEPVCFSESHVLAEHEEHKIVKAFDEHMMRLFIGSPEFYTPEFAQLWIETHGPELSINSRFLIKSSDEKEFYELYKNIDPDVLRVFQRCFIFIDQRSSLWIRMLNEFVCGNNGGTIDNSTFQGRYNLIRGAAIELLAMHLFDPLEHAGLKGFRKVNLGFIVEQNEPGAKGFAPNMVLISEPSEHSEPLEFILVEIKGLKYSRKNADYYRGLHLATKQIGSGRQILEQFISCEKLKIVRGIVLLCCVEDHQFKMEVHQVNIQ